ncbi:MAG: hypothetical protein OXG52_12845 [bacterium]|nr:hypothetical protein [bacterium]
MADAENIPGPAPGSDPASDAPHRGRDHLRLLGERVAPLLAAHERTLPALYPLRGLFPDGVLRRGWTIAVGGEVATSLALAVAAGPSASGSWTAVVGDPGLGLAAAAEAGVVLERLLMVDAPEPRAALEAVAALVGAVDIVLLGSETRLGAADHRRLAARLRERGSVLIRLAEGRGHGADVWTGGARSPGRRVGGPPNADVRLQVMSSRWCGLEDGWGLLRSRHVSVQVQGRGAAGRPRSVDLLLPGPDGSPVLLGPAARDATTPLRSIEEGPADLGCPGAGDAAVVA